MTMTSFATSLIPPLLSASSSSSSSSFSLRSDAFCNCDSLALKMMRLRLRLSNSGRKTPVVKAKGGSAKFKGTQMREKHLTEMIEKKVIEAKEACEGDETSEECKVAWDEVEEVSQAKADLRFKLEKKQDPLEHFCQDNPETDECRVYQD